MNRNILNLILSAAAITCGSIFFSGCHKQEKKYRIGVSQCSRDDWREKMNDEINREIMFHDDAEVEIRSADDNSRKQISDLKYFVDNGFDIIIVSPNEANTLTPVIADIYNNGMPVIVFDRNINGDSYTARIGVDDEGIGKSAAHYSFTICPPHPKAIELYGLPGSTPAKGRHEGFLAEFTSSGGEILTTVPANWNKEDAMRVTDSLLAIYPDVDLIYAHNDRMATGASEVAKRLGRNIRTIGIDAAPTIGIKAVSEGVIDASFLYPTEGYRLIQTALAILKNEPYEKNVILPASSPVDRSNADILLIQNESLNEDTGKMHILKRSIDAYWQKHSSQTTLLYMSIAVLVLFCFVFFLLLRSFWQNKRHQAILLDKNRQLEEERDKQKDLNQKLEDATQSKLAFFTNVSHDLRTPLTLIAEPVAQLSGASNLTPRQQTLLKIADKNVLILQRLINQILDFRKYEDGKLKLHLSEVNFSQLVADWTDSFNTISRKRNIHLTVDATNNGEDIIIALDAEKIERVFFNILSNAFKYTPDNGDISVTCRLQDDNLIMSIRDTGEGISHEDIGQIFDQFYQVDRVKPKGSGIGLSLTKAFVELHGGRISVESELRKGSLFTVTIPVRHVEPSNTSVGKNIEETDVARELDIIDTDANFETDKPVMLVIDDNKDIQKLLTELLSDSYNIICSNDGADGIKKANKYVPDIIICDVMMPGMDGMECCRRLKEELSTSHIPVVMLTACSMDEQQVQGYDSGADGYVSKPFNINVLRSKCRSIIENRKRITNILPGSSSKGTLVENDTEKKKRKLPASEIDSEFYNRFLEIFSREMGNPDANVDNIAGQLGLERSQFYRKIKALTNYSPVELMRNIRLKTARNMLLSTEKSISEIGYEVGFSTPAYFTKCYREAFSETPSETRATLNR